MKLLKTSEIDKFLHQGYLINRGLFDQKVALRIQDEIWEELHEEFGIKKDDISTWRTPPHSPRKAKISQTNDLLINDNFRSVIDDLIGKDVWEEPSSWGGFLITFPTDKRLPWTLHDKLWHWDYELFRENDLGGLLIFSFYSSVLKRGCGTLVIKGSHNLLQDWKSTLSEQQIKKKHGQHRKEVMKYHPYLNELTSVPENVAEHVAYFMDHETVVDDIELQVIELTGNPGDVVFCHPRLIHAPAAVNFNDYPRIMRTKFLW